MHFQFIRLFSLKKNTILFRFTPLFSLNNNSMYLRFINFSQKKKELLATLSHLSGMHILTECFLCNGNEVSYYIKKPGIPQHSIPEFRSVNHQSGSVMTYFFGSFPEMPSSAHWKASLYLPLDSLCSILRIFPDQSYDKAICGSV